MLNQAHSLQAHFRSIPLSVVSEMQAKIVATGGKEVRCNVGVVAVNIVPAVQIWQEDQANSSVEPWANNHGSMSESWYIEFNCRRAVAV